MYTGRLSDGVAVLINNIACLIFSESDNTKKYDLNVSVNILYAIKIIINI